MRKRLRWIGGGLALLAVVAAGAGYLLYESGAFRSTETERGETVPESEVDEPVRPVVRRPPRAPASWPVFRFDGARDGVNPRARARPPFNVSWSHKVPREGCLEAPAVVSGGLVVYGSYGKRFGSDLFARDARTGRLRRSE